MKRTTDTYYDYVIGSLRWARFRERILLTRGRRCEACGIGQIHRDLELHHLTYERLGNERDEDVKILCITCHAIADREREIAVKARIESERYWARVDGWASKRYGDDWNDFRSSEDVAEEFEEWLDDRE